MRILQPPPPTPVKLCINCNHYLKRCSPPQCDRKVNNTKTSLVTGEPVQAGWPVACHYERTNQENNTYLAMRDTCGPAARYFVPKEEADTTLVSPTQSQEPKQ